MAITWIIFEFVGTLAFAFSGAMVGIKESMDLFGIVVLSIMTAVGGGILRDLMVGNIPVTIFKHPASFLIAIILALVLSIVYRITAFSFRKNKIFKILFDVSDTLGLGAFTVTGATMSLYMYPEMQYVAPITLGVITAVGGGLLRDMAVPKRPVVLYADIYATASLAGSVILCVIWSLGYKFEAEWAGFIVVVLLRFFAIIYKWQLFKPVEK